ncbi:MAG: Mur ligase family protein [Bacillota bacterium]|jgi:dihydrofolate synthase/folylpolyglutamate synthase|nr:Mur ligase family protein [Bacillota bacterium]MDY0118503.1 Mur ligase family protein [Bacilli bacterium]HOF65687.1 Mur ligase family protein [Bacilli bacterium]HPK86359.1 Mur ligase family protein [Bacilli bacterium]
MTINDVKTFLLDRDSRQYERRSYDKFLKEVNFSFDKPAIHIGGTNGKGSVTAFLVNAYLEEGYLVGAFNSPHLDQINEMITLKGVPISDEALIHYINKYYEKIIKYNLTFFEIMTIAALSYFTDMNVDIAIIEVGMGGLMDATNIFTPILSIITSINLEHTQYLGNSLAEIARHKGGIIKEKTPVLLGYTNKEAENVIKNISLQKQAPFLKPSLPFNVEVNLGGLTFSYNEIQNIYLPNIFATYEARDASIAIEAIKILSKVFPVDEKNLKKGFAKTVIPARFTIVSSKPLIIVDGAHNPAAAMKLVNSVRAFTNKKVDLIFASFRDKDVDGELQIYSMLCNSINLTTFNHPRAKQKDEYFYSQFPFYENYRDLIKDKMSKLGEDEVLLITGSLAFAGKVVNEFKEGVY